MARSMTRKRLRSKMCPCSMRQSKPLAPIVHRAPSQQTFRGGHRMQRSLVPSRQLLHLGPVLHSHQRKQTTTTSNLRHNQYSHATICPQDPKRGQTHAQVSAATSIANIYLPGQNRKRVVTGVSTDLETCPSHHLNVSDLPALRAERALLNETIDLTTDLSQSHYPLMHGRGIIQEIDDLMFSLDDHVRTRIAGCAMTRGICSHRVGYPIEPMINIDKRNPFQLVRVRHRQKLSV